MGFSIIFRREYQKVWDNEMKHDKQHAKNVT